MKIVASDQLAIPEVKTIRFARFQDHRGYFTEHFRESDFAGNPATPFLSGVRFVQANESFSRAGTIRGLHFQWNPHMGKLVRTLRGHLIDVALDIRKGSPTFGKIVAHDMPSDGDEDFNEWIWVPPGFAHGTVLLEDTLIEYFCSGEYSPGCEAGISPRADDIDWSLCDPTLAAKVREIAATTELLTDKDRDAPNVAGWAADARSANFVHGSTT
ncbi:MAG: dTDP-4-dehydrorhamnose 3,5-epimerase [uncultured Thermomicrobiales bacterium]|uniref:dTDP-4-dehydrorhamnose 3,5-epimerase n=1 Tax=uncultured Thermomicrobiales bacterium TaxID=1645740 RepID=A0A6J4UTE7_9BACT|nr:MAG: dTDP-4-dehydrorhamnose 3,5-epimerase [uncultured Thermomicrobiales bacterium]